MKQIIVRFPPSPTGFLHVGNARIALINWLFAKKNNGKIILRFDDTDGERVKEEYKEQMKQDLAFLGLTFDEVFEQSARIKVYKEVFNELLEKGFVYPCFETEEELETKRKIALANGKPPIYERCQFTEEQKKQTPYFRFKLTGDKTQWKDLIQGEISYEVKALSDPVVLRANGNFMYTFCSVVDDFLMNISHIIRGADHITNTAIQIQIWNAICEVKACKKQVEFAHLPLFQGKEGKISKRVGGFSIMQMQKNGFEPEAIINVLAKIGLSSYDDNLKTLDELVKEFDILHFNKAQIYFDFSLIEIFNKKRVHTMKYEEVKKRINPEISEKFFEKIKDNLTFLSEVESWNQIFTNKDTNFLHLINPEDSLFLKEVSQIINKMEVPTWKEIMEILKPQFPQRKGKMLFLPIRLALTGQEHGPEMQFIIEGMGKQLLLKRLS